MRLYDSDVTDAQWAVLEPHVHRKKRRGPKSRVDLRVVVNAIFYRMRTGCQWRMLPKGYGSWEVVYGYWYRWARNGTWERITTALREAVRRQAGKRAKPTVAITDSQSVRTVRKGGGAASMPARGSRAASGI